MKLMDLPSELFGYLSAFWDARMLLRLRSAGNHVLLDRIDGPHGVRSFEWTDDPPWKFLPHGLSRLTNLRHLHLAKATESDKTPKFPISLEYINLQFPRSAKEYLMQCGMLLEYSQVAVSGPTWCSPGVNFPNLHTLILLDHPNFSELNKLWSTLPNGILTVSVTNPDNSGSMGDLEFPSSLPDSLESLEMQRNLAMSETPILWPKNLTFLRLPHTMWTLSDPSFPSTLRELNIGFNFYTPYLLDEEVVEWQKSFANLNSLRVRTNHSYQLLQLIRPLTLGSLTLVNSLTAMEIELLPQSVTFLDIRVIKSVRAPQLYEKLPKLLEHFHLGHENDKPWMINNKWLSKLPSSLKTLEISFCEALTSESVIMLPNTLTECSLLFNAKLSHAAIASLPRGLKVLSILQRSDRLALLNSDIPNLPSGLETFRIESPETQLSDPCLRALPCNLKIFVHSSNTSFSDFGIACLPSNLTTLHLPTNMTIGNAGIARLPSTLTELILRGDSLTLTSKCFASLPHSMKRLYLHNVASVDDNSLEKLPRSMQSINLPGLQLSASCLLRLPHTILRVVLRDNKSLNPKSLKKLPPNLMYLALRENPNFDRSMPRKKIPRYLTFISAHKRYKSHSETASLWDSTRI